MSYRYKAARRLQRKSKRNFIITLILVVALLYIAFVWILPNLIGGVSIIKNFTNPAKKIINVDQVSLAPPVLNIPFEATNTGQINISGYSTPGAKVEVFVDDDKKQTVSVSTDGSFNINNLPLSLGNNEISGKTVVEGGKESLPSKTLRILYDNEKPKLNLNEPADNKTIRGGDKKVKFSGKTEPGAQVFINNTQVIVDKDGNFSSDQVLNDGDNNFEIKAVDSASNATEISRKVIFQP